VANAYTQPMEILFTTQRTNNVSDTIMSSVTAPLFKPSDARLEVYFVIGDQDILG
jgi:hypothetical protein